MTVTASNRCRRASAAHRRIPKAIERFVDLQIGEVTCTSCKHHRMELISVTPQVFLAGSRLIYRCGKCPATAGVMLLSQHDVFD